MGLPTFDADVFKGAFRSEEFEFCFVLLWHFVLPESR